MILEESVRTSSGAKVNTLDETHFSSCPLVVGWSVGCSTLSRVEVNKRVGGIFSLQFAASALNY